mgnify:CR=1 FL=1
MNQLADHLISAILLHTESLYFKSVTLGTIGGDELIVDNNSPVNSRVELMMAMLGNRSVMSNKIRVEFRGEGHQNSVLTLQIQYVG